MKLNKASEDTLKGLAKLLKTLKEADPASAISAFLPNIKAVEKDLRQLRKHLGELPEPAQATAEFREPTVTLFRDDQGFEIKIAPMVSNPEAERDLEQALNELRALRDEPPVSYGTNLENPCKDIVTDKAPIIDLAHEALTDIRQTYVDTYGPLPQEIVSNDIDWHVKELIKESKKPKLDEVVLTPPQTCVLGTTIIMDEPVIYVNPDQIEKGANLIAARKQPEGLMTEPLYRKK